MDLPDELLRAAKARAAAGGETLKQLLKRAVAQEIGTATNAARRGRLQLPLVGSTRPGVVDITNAEIEATFAAEDAEKVERR